MNLQEKLKQANLDKDHPVTLICKDGEDVIHVWEDYQEEVLASTGIATTLAELITDPSFKGNEVLEEMRDHDLLELYPRDNSGFSDYVADVITENFFEFDWIDRSTEQYDYKRGFLTLEARVNTTVGKVLAADQHTIAGWKVNTVTDLGHMTIEG